MNQKGLSIALTILVAIFSFSFSAFGEMTSTNFQIQWDSISAGGDDTSTSASYILRDSVDASGASQATSANSYLLDQGYRAGVYDRVADFQIFLESRSTQVSAISVASTTVTVASVSGYSVGDMVLMVENEGESQVAAMGKITAISDPDPDITVDEWRYSTALPSVGGVDDYLYNLNATATTMPEPTASTLATTVIGWEVSADISDGFSVYVYENQNLTNGTDTINDVTDGAVTVGSREYGARSSDTTLTSDFDTQDVGITSNLQQVGSRTSNSFETRDFITLKASANGFESSGTYSHTITILYVGDY